MARKVVISVIDDLDKQSAAVETVSFGIDGVMYEIDLSEANAGNLRAAVDKWTPFARRVGRSRRGSGRGKNTQRARGGQDSPTQIREWARRNGHEISQRGRIPAEIVNAYNEAKSESKA